MLSSPHLGHVDPPSVKLVVHVFASEHDQHVPVLHSGMAVASSGPIAHVGSIPRILSQAQHLHRNVSGRGLRILTPLEHFMFFRFTIVC